MINIYNTKNKKAPVFTRAYISIVVRPAGFEPATARLEGVCSIQLSYGRTIKVTTFNIIVSLSCIVKKIL